MGKKFFYNAMIVNEGTCAMGSVLVYDNIIVKIVYIDEGAAAYNDFVHEAQEQGAEIIFCQGMLLMPGVIDDHVHFRDPGLTHKADMESESAAAAAGGVTTFFDMPNTKPQTVSIDDLNEKFRHAAECSHVNYSFFFGATNSNTEMLKQLDKKKVCGVKVFMGSSTGNMLVDNYESLKTIFKESPLPIMTHCEDTEIIDANMAEYKSHHGEDPDVKFHPEIRSVEACLKSTELAVKLAKETGARLHVAHITTADELELIPKSKAALNGNGEDKFENITAEACVSHLMFNDADYQTLGTRIKCNPAIKGEEHQKALQKALFDGRIAVVGTDHAPHLLSEKEGGCAKAVSGMPMLQFSLVSMLDLMTTLCNNDRQQAAIQTTRLMCHNPASLFGIRRRGYIRVGYKADFVIVREAEWTLKQGDIISKCGWSPLEGRKFHHQVYATYCNGNKVFDIKQGVDRSCIGEAVSFDR